MNPAPSAYDQIHKARLPLKTAMARRLYPHPRLVLTWCHRGSRLAVIGFLCAAADLNAQGGNLALTATTGVASRYVYRGVERSTTAWQAGVDGSVDGWRGQFWSNRPFDGAKTGELQSSLGYVWTPSGAITLEASGTHFWYVDPTIKGAAAHSFEGAAFMGWNRSDGWRPGVSLAYDIRYRSLAVETSLAYVVALKSWGTFLESRAYVGQLAGDDVLPDTTGAAVRDRYSYFGLDVRLPYRIAATTELAVAAGFAGTVGQSRLWSPLNRGAGSRAWLTFAVRFGL